MAAQSRLISEKEVAVAKCRTYQHQFEQQVVVSRTLKRKAESAELAVAHSREELARKSEAERASAGEAAARE